MHGDWVLFDTNGVWKTIIIKEVYVNEWTSKQTVRMYNKTPLKYQNYRQVIIKNYVQKVIKPKDSNAVIPELNATVLTTTLKVRRVQKTGYTTKGLVVGS